ncbi:hypothetical protein M0G43_07980 [Subsaxibacter sp. CAU 1640]|uniref:DUF6705 family protein n=1 Tax=Subsaxibacter sp. CAU 1640 TaxID=2933271 RepID=UPI002003AC0D|nr:DUF6705 family protein [Subsaxibacter sp. CAU 1640]MCK7590506.1 hypothetical protein [Subsaxibacter sp. CAU 1640]
MKYIYTTFLFLMLCLRVSAQTTIDMAGTSVLNETKNGQYYTKDINNYMQPYVGTWRYIDSDNEFRISLAKITMDHVVFPGANIDYYTDDLTIQYQKYENGVLIFNSSVKKGASVIKEFGKLQISFTDYQRNDSSFSLDLKLVSTGVNEHNKLKFELSKFETKNTYHDQHPNEPYFSVPNNIEMTKM